MPDNPQSAIRNPQSTWLTVSEVALRCGVSQSAVYEWIHEGHLVALRFGTRRCYRIAAEQFREFLARSTEF